MALFVICAALQAQEPFKAYGLKSAVIEYRHSGSRTGTATMYLDDFGAKAATWQDLIAGGKKEKGWIIGIGDAQYLFDPETKKGMKFKNQMVAILQKEKDYDKVAKDMYAKMGWAPAAPEPWLGKECSVYKGATGKVLTWNGLLMYLEMDIMGMKTKQEAVKLDVNVPVKPSLFVVPKDIEFSDMPGLGF